MIKRNVSDLGVATLLFVAAFAGGDRYVHRVISAGVQPEFYQNEFGVAVAAFCGHGYVNPIADSIPELSAFLNRQTDRFDCASLPSPGQMATTPLTGPQATWQYLLRAAATTWRIQGAMTWSGLQRWSGVLLGLTAVGAYTLLRIVSPAALAALGALAVVSSPLHLRYLVHLRDYAKTPFMLALGVAIALMLARRLSLRQCAVWGATVGAVLGVGVGIRNDLLIATPPLVMAALFGTLRDGTQRLARLAAALGATAAGFAIAAAPLLSAYSQGGGAGMSHVALLGLSPVYDQALGVERSPVYGFGHTYNDSAAAAVIAEAAFRRLRHTGPIAPYDATYDAASNTLVKSVFALMPADIWIRGLASTLKVVGLPASSVEDTEPPPLLAEGAVQSIYQRRAQWIRELHGVPMAVVVGAFVVGAAVAPAATAVAFLIVLYLAAYPAVQFHERHYFHLNVLPIGAAVFLSAAAWRRVSATLGRDRAAAEPPLALAVARIVAFAVFAAAVTLLPLQVLRGVQDRRLGDLFEAYQQAPRVALDVVERDGGEGVVAMDVTNLPASARAGRFPQTVQVEYLSFVLDGRCDRALLRMHLDYDNARGAEAFGRKLAYQAAGRQATRAFVPVYFFDGGVSPANQPIRFGFRGVTIDRDARSCISELSRVEDVSGLPLLLDLTLPAQWTLATRHQILQGWEESRRPESITVYASEAGAEVSTIDLERPLDPIVAASVGEHVSHFSFVGSGRVTVDGRGGLGDAGRYSYLALFKPETVGRGQRLVGAGELRSGGFTVGLISQGQWVAQVSVTSIGRFVVVVDTPIDLPSATVAFANHNTGWSTRTHFELTRLGWIR